MSRAITERVEITDEMLKPSKRLIDANALIAEMHNIILEDGEDRRTFYEVIERQPTVEERKWIPWDSGRLPDDSGTYIVTAYDGVQERVTFAKYQKRMKRWELTGARAYWRVLAWMPLPESYSGETESRDYENKGDDD